MYAIVTFPVLPGILLLRYLLPKGTIVIIVPTGRPTEYSLFLEQLRIRKKVIYSLICIVWGSCVFQNIFQSLGILIISNCPEKNRFPKPTRSDEIKAFMPLTPHDAKLILA
jgi:hypothetical protein